MKVCIGGQWRSIAGLHCEVCLYAALFSCVRLSVDDNFPCLKGDKPQPIFSRCTDPHEIWVLVAEKAWAKLHTSYQRFDNMNSCNACMMLYQYSIESGNCGFALHCLSGAPSEFITTNKADRPACDR